MSVGTQIAGYRLEELVGKGGMGVVYRAHDLALERSVALKLLSPSLAEDPAFRERFLVESRLAASLDHPNVVPIYDAGEVEGQLYLAMRYVEGSDLKELLTSEETLEPSRAIAICSQIGDALDAAHARGLVHRDVKPSNVLLDEREHAYLADFGLTRRLSDQAPGFESGLSLGTPAYVAPEQIEGAEVDGRADQYSLACLLHECLTGQPPFPRGSELATLFAHLEEPPPAPPGLEEVMLRALAKSSGQRYPSCAELMAAVRDALQGDVGARRRTRRRRRLVAATTLLTLIGASIATVLAGDNSESAGPPAITQNSIAGATVGHTQSYYKNLFGGWRALVLAEPGFPSLAFQDPEVAVYFPVEGQPAHIITTWNRDYRTSVGIGPCSTVEEMKNAYGDAVKPSWSGTSPEGDKVFQWVVGDNLVFATFLDQKVVRAVALYDGDPNNTREGSPQAYAGYVAAVETSCK